MPPNQVITYVSRKQPDKEDQVARSPHLLSHAEAKKIFLINSQGNSI